ncbi:hypothetical protein [Phenylobacterium sp.]|uniref:hypothetical protein n=1 Tax=Phenylobacterium sp. TaxID=1871053 RepID=UPI002DF35D5C|nr:hypothetical protein [Phenylobacterium sp.]
MKRTLALVALAAPLLIAAAPPRSPDGHPDLTGVWTNASVTHLTRPAGMDRLVVSPAEAAVIAKGNPLVRRIAADAKPSKLDENVLDDGDTGAGYNLFWIEPGQTLGRVNGQYRTSWIVDPADGQLPLSAEGRKRIAASAAAHRTALAEGPEALMPWDRCLISSRGSGGPGMLNNIYNSNYQIVQTPGAVAIVVEMIHDVRNIPVFPTKAAALAGHGPAVLHPWLGDSVGWWEGPTLVVETRNVNPEQGRTGPLYLSPDAKVIERFTRVSAEQITYAFAVDDPAYYSRPWRAEMSLNARKDMIYEYACHEGNYGLAGVLAGARKEQTAAITAR